MTRPVRSGEKRARTDDGVEVIKGDKGEGMHITLHSKPRRVPCRTPGFAYMPRGRGLTKFMLKPVSFGFSRLKEADANVTQGYFPLQHISSGACPLHVFSLGTIRNVQLGPPATGFIYNDGGFYTPIGDSELDRITDVTSNNTETIEKVSNHALIWRKAEVNMLLYQREKQSTTYDITFFKILDENMDPNEAQQALQVGSGAAFSQVDSKNYWNPIVQRYTQNPATLSKPFPNALNKGRAPIRVLKKYRVVIREKLSTEDTINKRTVKFLLTPNQVMNYDLSPAYAQIADVTGQSDVTTIPGYKGADIVRYYPRTTQNIYMSIAANAYHDETESADGYKQPSYDLALRTTYDAVNAAT